VTSKGEPHFGYFIFVIIFDITVVFAFAILGLLTSWLLTFNPTAVCTENLICVDEMMESRKLAG
jgi:hypothetical protein